MYHVSREICKLCYHVNAVGFSVPDEIWATVVPKPLRDRILCLQCFTRLADEKCVPWDRDIKLYPVSMYTHIFKPPGILSPEEARAIESCGHG